MYPSFSLKVKNHGRHLPWAFTLCAFRLYLAYRKDSTCSSFFFRLNIFFTTNGKTHSPRIYVRNSLLLNSSPHWLPSAVSAVVLAAVMYRAILRAIWIIISIRIIFILDQRTEEAVYFGSHVTSKSTHLKRWPALLAEHDNAPKQEFLKRFWRCNDKWDTTQVSECMSIPISAGPRISKCGSVRPSICPSVRPKRYIFQMRKNACFRYCMGWPRKGVGTRAGCCGEGGQVAKGAGDASDAWREQTFFR